MSDEIQYISISIADLPRIRLSIPNSQVPLVRRVEENINGLWRKWKERDDFRDKSSAEVLAMVTFRFAQLYYSNMEAVAHLEETLGGMEQTFDALLLDDIVSDSGIG
ncbi:MAG: hypothetical protein K2G27_03455 [Duncaniella sp.]|nr:hypothetical protein [Duncaniella sp.]